MPLLRRDFLYELPEDLIAQTPAPVRTGSRLLVLDPVVDRVEHRQFVELAGYLEPGDLLVVNDTRVIPARLHGRKDSGGRAEILIERIIDRNRALCQVRVSKPLKPGRVVAIDPDGLPVRAVARCGDLLELEFPAPVLDVLETRGEVPLPPYIQRAPVDTDRQRYQTVYARDPGAVAAPTAGLHFDETLLEHLRQKGVEMARVTLHVGAGTFQPMRTEELARHRMHRERVRVGSGTVSAIERCRHRNRRVIAIGTTVVRALETAARDGSLAPYDGETDIFIHPGFTFRAVDALVTNFHLPESTLLMLVSAFAGRERVLSAYAEAVSLRYRFFSYGDAMFITRRASDVDAV